MAFWGRMFGSRAVSIVHPSLGSMTCELHSAWRVNEVASIGCRGKPSLSLAGDGTGPSPECVATYQRIRENWNTIGSQVAQDIFELNQNYFSEDPSQGMQSANDVWEAIELLAIDIFAEGKFSLTYRFDWQNPNDDHEVTLYFENWLPTGNSIDG